MAAEIISVAAETISVITLVSILGTDILIDPIGIITRAGIDQLTGITEAGTTIGTTMVTTIGTTIGKTIGVTMSVTAILGTTVLGTAAMGAVGLLPLWWVGGLTP